MLTLSTILFNGFRYEGYSNLISWLNFYFCDFVNSVSDENVSDSSDDDMISCQICLLRFNTKNRKPKYLDCKYLIH